MPGVTIEKMGLLFVQACAKKYWGECMFLPLFAAGLIWSLFCHKKQTARFFCCYTLCLCLTVFNPILVKYVIPKIKFEKEYYRFFWLLPVIPGIAYYAVRIIFSLKKTWKRVLASFLAVIVICVTGSPLLGVIREPSIIENIYKVPNELRAACAVIHQDSELENPRTVFDVNMNLVVRQYDASFHLPLERDAILYRHGNKAVNIDPKTKRYRIQKTIMDVVYFNESVEQERFQKALVSSRTDYLVIPSASPKHEYLKECGCIAIAQTEEHVIYRFPWKEVRQSLQS